MKKVMGSSKSSIAFIKRGNFQDNMDHSESLDYINYVYCFMTDSQYGLAVRRTGK
jgi:hypothetical protein